MSDLIARHATWLKAAGRADTTIAARVRLLHHADRHLPLGLDRAHTDEIQAYQSNPDWSAWSRYTYDSHFRGFYRYGVEIGEYTMDPTLAIPRPPEGNRLPDPVTDRELTHLFEHAPRWWHPVLALAAYAGLRVSEIARLRRQDITEERIRVRCGKGGKDGYVDTHPIVWALVRDTPVRQGKRATAAVHDDMGAEVTGYQLTSRGWYLFHSLGLPDVHLHRLRHWHATSLIANGADLETVRQCMRHANLSSTGWYVLISNPARRAAVHRLPAMGHGPADIRPVPTAEAA